ncbi:hypothetical protein Q73A0000_05140 [Kaistella flava (ex Peng et al. 2021)]|uniref:Uncharacterized protein n=1 Tax=Kaistella flava (ex Peng et al. 2021) TaxID=2038776 RepID=A0A7M2Y849_9FLAO|nr:hypothetical protein [Kaistella flava (ex Peng et al. 2021)]QOW09795.1 hypothetical protein Q73A0000_05140 [Kaistella flava (ex Peng et al. 2021)]
MCVIYQFSREENNIIFNIENYIEHHFYGEIIFPFPNIKFYYFTEEHYFLPYNIEEHVKEYVGNLISILEDIAINIEYIKEISAKFCQYNKHSEDGKNNIRRIVIDPFIENTINKFPFQNVGLTFKQSLAEAIFKVLIKNPYYSIRNKEIQHEDIFEDILSEYKYIINLDGEENWSIYPKLHERFFEEMGEDCKLLKMLQTNHKNTRIPDEYLEQSGIDEYLNKEDGKLPLFIGTQFGISPKIIPELIKRMEGQKVVFLNKSQLSGYEHSMDLKLIKNGEFKTLKKITREQIENINYEL